MASLPLPFWSGHATPSASAIESPPQLECQASLSAYEWSIVAMAERDGLASVREQRGLGFVLRRFFGLKPANRLANERLEALRRVAVFVWRYRWSVPTSEIRAFVAAGYSTGQLQLLQSRISQARADRGRRNTR